MNQKVKNAQAWIQAAVQDARQIEQTTDSIKERAAARAIITDLHDAFESLAKVSHQMPAIGQEDAPVSLRPVG